MNYYDILGVDKNADQQQIKQAYRRLASKHHPDRGGDEAEFKRIQEAYDVLGDTEKRAQYDNPQPNFGGFHQGQGHPFEDIFGSFFHQRPQQRANPDATVDVRIDISTAYNGGEVALNLNNSREILRIKPGTRNGTKYRIQGKGHHRFADLPPGDLIVRVFIVTPHDMTVQNDDVFQRITVGALDAMTGTELTVQHFSGKDIKVKIPKGSQHGSKLRLSGWGMPHPQNFNQKGNLYLIVDIKIPIIHNDEHLELLNKIKDEVAVYE